MSGASTRAMRFYKDVVEGRRIWTLKDDVGFPAPRNTEGKRSMPFWSDLNLLEKVTSNSSEYKNFKPHELSLEEFLTNWVPGLAKDGLLIGLNWSGESASGYDYTPEEVLKNFNYYMVNNAAKGL